MSRKPSSSSPRAAAAAPYPRRNATHPKSSRQQFSACGACRMRRVRCDLKEFCNSTTPNDSPPPSCSNCRERSIKCVDEFAEVKAVKLLRRGRRLQQVEAVYGKVSNNSSPNPGAPDNNTSNTFPPLATVTSCSVIPRMQLPFLKSSFFRRFCVQRPIIEPSEFTSRYVAHMEGTAPLTDEGKLLAMLLIIWAASFGVDEFGNENPQNDPSQIYHASSGDQHKRHASVLRTNAMIREVLTLVDHHGLLRRPSWDGVRVLLLMLPLTHGVQSDIERLTTYEATLSQVYTLCNIDTLSVSGSLETCRDILVRARVFWYAYVHESITTGLKGGRLQLDDDALTTFQNSLPPHQGTSASSSSVDSSPSPPTTGSPVSQAFPFLSSSEKNHPKSALAYLVTSQYFSLALDVAQVCRCIHSTLTGPRARRRIKSGVAMHEDVVVEIWENLERCWDNLERLRHNPSGVGAAGGDLIRGEDVERFVSGWQVFIFQCLNIIREALSNPTEDSHAAPVNPSVASLHSAAIHRCHKFLPKVIKMLQRHLRVPSNFFTYDAGLIRDGCFFAGLLLAQSDQLDVNWKMMGCDVDWEEGVMACLQALGEIRWAHAHTQERERTLKAEWEARIERETNGRLAQRSPIFPLKESPGHSPCLTDSAPLPSTTARDSKPRSLSLVSAGGQVRPLLPPLSVSFPLDDSGPDTALTDDGSGSWELYTPPPTSASLTGPIITHRSLSPASSSHNSTIVSTHCTLKDRDILFDSDDDDMDQLSFAGEGTPDSRMSVSSKVRAQWTPFSGNYLDPHAVLSTSDVLGCDDRFSPLGHITRQPFF